MFCTSEIAKEELRWALYNMRAKLFVLTTILSVVALSSTDPDCDGRGFYDVTKGICIETCGEVFKVNCSANEYCDADRAICLERCGPHGNQKCTEYEFCNLQPFKNFQKCTSYCYDHCHEGYYCDKHSSTCEPCDYICNDYHISYFPDCRIFCYDIFISLTRNDSPAVDNYVTAPSETSITAPSETRTTAPSETSLYDDLLEKNNWVEGTVHPEYSALSFAFPVIIIVTVVLRHKKKKRKLKLDLKKNLPKEEVAEGSCTVVLAADTDFSTDQKGSAENPPDDNKLRLVQGCSGLEVNSSHCLSCSDTENLSSLLVQDNTHAEATVQIEIQLDSENPEEKKQSHQSSEDSVVIGENINYQSSHSSSECDKDVSLKGARTRANLEIPSPDRRLTRISNDSAYSSASWQAKTSAKENTSAEEKRSNCLSKLSDVVEPHTCSMIAGSTCSASLDYMKDLTITSLTSTTLQPETNMITCCAYTSCNTHVSNDDEQLNFPQQESCAHERDLPPYYLAGRPLDLREDGNLPEYDDVSGFEDDSLLKQAAGIAAQDIPNEAAAANVNRLGGGVFRVNFGLPAVELPPSWQERVNEKAAIARIISGFHFVVYHIFTMNGVLVSIRPSDITLGEAKRVLVAAGVPEEMLEIEIFRYEDSTPDSGVEG